MHTDADATLEPPRELTISAFYQAWQQLSPNELIIDVRSPDDFNTAHVPGSRNIPMASATNHCEELKKFDKLYFYCYGGKGSKATTAKLAELGLANLCYLGQAGMEDWISAGYPVE